MKRLTTSFLDIDEWAAALKGEEEVQKFCQAERTGLLTADPEALTKSLLATLLPEVDKKAVLEDENTGNDIVTSIKEALRVSCDGWVDDDLAFLQHCKHQPPPFTDRCLSCFGISQNAILYDPQQATNTY